MRTEECLPYLLLSLASPLQTVFHSEWIDSENTDKIILKKIQETANKNPSVLQS